MSFFKKQWEQGRLIYGHKSWRETRRTLLHTLRTVRDRKYVEQFNQFFADYQVLPDLLEKQPGLYEVMSRIFFYKGSTAAERLEIVKDHFEWMSRVFTPEAMALMYTINPKEDIHDIENLTRGLIIWSSDELDMKARLYFEPGQRKEGLITLLLTIGNEGLYHVNFRLATARDGQLAMIIGTLQGYKQGLDNAKKATKSMYGYRPKNFIMFLVQELAQCMGVHHIYAVSDEGFYANTHLVRGHKAKVAQLDPLWKELGGTMSEDARFFALPMQEERKTIEEIKSQKRSQYRKRYALLDEYILQVRKHCQDYVRFMLDNKQ